MRRAFVVFALGALVTFFVAGSVVADAARPHRVTAIAVEGNDRVESMPLPAQPTAAEAAAIVASADTTQSQCFGDDRTPTIPLPSSDPAHPGSQDVVFFKE